MRLMRVAFFLFVASVIYDNLSGFQLVRPLGLEPFGFLLMLLAMGLVTAEKTIASEQKLLSVERELEIARKIQLSILPEKVPETKGLEVAVRYVPMTQVAGDFYDFIELPDERLGVLVADVSGHGVPAALIASMLKMAFVSHAPAAENPAEMLSKLNTALCGRFSSHFVTAVYAVLDPAAGTITYSGAAHPPMLVKRGDGKVDELSENGLMLGAFDFAQYANASTVLGPADQVLLYTDGLAEANNVADEEFGIARLKECFDGAASRSIEQLFAKTAAWTANVPQQDDLTAVVVVRR
jgi:sigma-B regulation protein RsbU (phosphoserine phosphatase)